MLPHSPECSRCVPRDIGKLQTANLAPEMLLESLADLKIIHARYMQIHLRQVLVQVV